MYKVEAETLEAYFAFDAGRTGDLQAMDELIRHAAPKLTRWFYPGVQAGEAGMRIKLIGYGTTVYRGTAGKTGKWPVIGLALQKNYISVYLAADKNGVAILETYRGRLGETRAGENNFSFVRFAQLDKDALLSLIQDAATCAGEPHA